MARSADPRNLVQQLGALSCLPVTRSAEIRRNRLIWRAELQPTPLSLTYAVGLAYSYRGPAPRVEVLRPELKEEGISTLPHVLAGDALCLCYPWQWDEGKLIARTIVPWISEWLLHFELWKIDRVWRGGGHEPGAVAG